MNDKTTILNLLNKFSNDHKDTSWKLDCSYSDGLETTINEIKILAKPDNRCVGIFIYRVETGTVLFCTYKKIKNKNAENIIDLLLDIINYSKGEISI